MSGKVEIQGIVFNAKLINEFLTELESEPYPGDPSIVPKRIAENPAQKQLCNLMRRIDNPQVADQDNGTLTGHDLCSPSATAALLAADQDNGTLTGHDRNVWKRWIKRAQTLDKFLQPPTGPVEGGKKTVREAGVFEKLIDQWKMPKRESWKCLWEETSSLRARLRDFVIAHDAFIEAAPPPKLRVLTTPLLAFRYWPDISRKFHEVAGDKEPMPVDVICGEPVELIGLAREDGDYDVIVTYGDSDLVNSVRDNRIKFPEDTELSRQHAEFHRCLLLPAGTCRRVWPDYTAPRVATRSELPKLVEGKSVAVIRNFELIYGQKLTNELLRAGARLVRFNQTLELHTFVRAGSGPCVSHIEALGETDAKALDSIELDPKDFGRSSLLVVPSTEIHEGTGAKSRPSAQLLMILKQMAKEGFENYTISSEVTKWLSSFPNCYCTSVSLMKKHGGKNGTDSEFKEFHWWRGRANAKVTPGLWISGDYELFGINDPVTKENNKSQFKYEEAKRPMTFRLFGRVARLSKRSNNEWQMTLRGTADSAEIFQSFFVLGSLSSAPDYIIGHWIGRMDQADHKGPDAGTWIWHKSKDLKVDALNQDGERLL